MHHNLFLCKAKIKHTFKSIFKLIFPLHPFKINIFVHVQVHFTIASQFYVYVNVEFYVHMNVELFLHAFLNLYGGEKQVCFTLILFFPRRVQRVKTGEAR